MILEKRIGSRLGLLFGILANVGLGFPGAVLMELTRIWFIEFFYRSGWISTNTPQAFSDGFGFAGAFLVFGWLVLVPLLAVVNIVAVKHIELRIRFYLPIASAAFLALFVAGSIDSRVITIIWH
jgi:hypothetical protein